MDELNLDDLGIPEVDEEVEDCVDCGARVIASPIDGEPAVFHYDHCSSVRADELEMV